MTNYRLLTCLLVLCLSLTALSAQNNRNRSGAFTGDQPVATFGNTEVGLLNQAYRQFRAGDFELALLTYDAILANRPNWLPGLAGKAELLQRIGRSAEAAKYRSQAERIDPLATGFLLSRGRNALLRYLALYPNSGTDPTATTDAEIAEFSQADYFERQLTSIARMPDSVGVTAVLQAKVSGDRVASIRALHRLVRDGSIDADLGFMLEGNLDILNHDYLGAVAAYNQAIDFHRADWPEVRYNRGLAFILIDNYSNGCAELRRSADSGFEPAERMLRGLCGF